MRPLCADARHLCADHAQAALGKRRTRPPRMPAGSLAWRPMTTGLGFDPRCLAHDNGSMLVDQRAAEWLDVPHVERPERLGRTWAVFEQAGLVEALTLLESRPATRDELALVHTPRLIDAIEAQPAAGGPPRPVGLGAAAGPGSWEAALYSAGIVLAATEAVAAGSVTNAFALVRPPGHHASADQAM